MKESKTTLRSYKHQLKVFKSQHSWKEEWEKVVYPKLTTTSALKTRVIISYLTILSTLYYIYTYIL